MLGNFMRKLGNTQSAPPDKELVFKEKTIQNIQQRVNLLRNNIHKWNEYQCLISELGLLITNDFIKLTNDNSSVMKKLSGAQVTMTSQTHQVYKAQIADNGGLAHLERWADTGADLLQELGEVQSKRNVAYEAKMKLETAKSGGRTSVLGIGSSQQYRPVDLQRMDSKYKSLVQAFRVRKKEFLGRAKEFEAQQSSLQSESVLRFLNNQLKVFQGNFKALRHLQESVDVYNKDREEAQEVQDLKEGDVVEVQIIAGVDKGRWIDAVVKTHPTPSGRTPPAPAGMIGIVVKDEEIAVVNPSTYAPLICVRKKGFRGSDHSLPSVALSLPESIQDVKRYENVLPSMGFNPQSPVKPSPPKKQAPQKRHQEPNVPVQNVVHSTPVQLNIESDSPQPPSHEDHSTTADLLGWGTFLSTNTLPEVQQKSKKSSDSNADEVLCKDSNSSKKELSPNILGSFFNDLPTSMPDVHEDNFLSGLSGPGAVDINREPNNGVSRKKTSKIREDSFMSDIVKDTGVSLGGVGFISTINEKVNDHLNEFDPFGFGPSVAKSKPIKTGRAATVSQIGEDMMKNFGAKDDKFSARERREINLAVEKKVREFNEDRQNEKAIEIARQDAFERLDPRIRVWEYQDDHTRRNIRNLLSTLEQILWDNSGWKGCSLSDLLSFKGVKKHYRKAIMIVHPDNHQKASLEVQVVSERAFEALNEQWKSFEKEVSQNN